ncbi:MAG: ComEA family DNA-binding protein [Myxococcota bacterium]
MSSIHSDLRASQDRSVRHDGRFSNAFAFLLLALVVGLGAVPGFAADVGATLDLNTATAEQLESLPGIGEVKAAAILAVRAERGGFRSVEELESVRGIGPALVGKLRGQVKVGPPRGGAARKVATK